MNNANGLYNNLSQFSNIPNTFEQLPEQGLLDSPLGFNHSVQHAPGINPGSLDLSQFPNHQMPQQRPHLDALGRSQSSPYHNSAYQVSSVVPAKRSRPGEESSNTPNNGSNGPITHNTGNGIGLSPQQNPSSRSQTPQQTAQFQNTNFPAMQNTNNPFNAAGLYQHLQNTNQPQATPSPTMQNQNFRSQTSIPPRMQSNSPHSMSGANTPFASQNQMLSNSGRMPTPQSSAMIQAMNSMGIPNQGMMQSPFPGQFGNVNNQAHGQIPPSMQMSEQYRMRMAQVQQAQQQIQHNLGPSHQRPAAPIGPNMAMAPQGQNTGAHPQTQPRNNVHTQAQSFQKNLVNFCAQNNIPLDPDPRVCGRQINWFHLFATVTRTGVMTGPPEAKGNWMRIAGLLQFPEPQLQQAAVQIKELFEQNLMPYFVQYNKRMNAQRHPQRASTGGNQSLQGSPPAQVQAFPRGSQQSAPSPGFIQQGQRSGVPSMSPTPSIPPNIVHNSMNGNVSPSKPQQQPRPPSSQQHLHDGVRKSSIANISTTQSEMVGQAMSGAASRTVDGAHLNMGAEGPPLASKHLTEHHLSTEWNASKHQLLTYGGIDVQRAALMGSEILRSRPGMSMVNELGIVDMHDLARRLQSGFPSEVTPALNQLVTLSAEVMRIPLKLLDCGDLLDSLIDCGEQQLDLLSKEISPEDSKGPIPTVNTLFKLVRNRDSCVQQRTFIGDEDLEYEHAADRIIAILTILRNLSFVDYNHLPLAEPSVTTFLCHLLRLLRSERYLLRSARNTLDVMKDAVTLLSNVAQKLKFPTKDHASIFLDFLLAFTPPGSSVNDPKGHMKFMPYHPTQHQYLPCAVDSLAKLLAHDHPNRLFFKTIFAGDGGRSGELLTRAFALIISVVPERPPNAAQKGTLVRIATGRIPFLSQGMIAADILATLIPDTDRGIAQSWLESDDGWVVNLLHLVLQLAVEPPPPQPRRSSSGPPNDMDAPGFDLITQHSLSMIQRLVDRSAKQDEGLAAFSTAGWPPLQEAVLDALSNPHFDPVVLKHLCALAKCVR